MRRWLIVLVAALVLAALGCGGGAPKGTGTKTEPTHSAAPKSTEAPKATMPSKSTEAPKATEAAKPKATEASKETKK